MSTNVMNSFSLADKTVLITGGAGLYGSQIARACAQAGGSVYVTSRDEARLEEIEENFRRDGIKVNAIPFDQEDLGSISSIRKKLEAREGKCDVLINNAVARTMSHYNDSLETFARSMAVNATGLFELTRVIGDWMAEKGSGGSIINIGSIQGMVGPDPTLYEGLPLNGLIPDYFFHKGGMINFTRFIASYYGASQVRCNCISPGGFQTEKNLPEFIQRYNDRTMLGRMAKADDIWGPVVFLASDASQYVTGTNLPVDGGYTAK
ncbi:SDR family oxidoreductase [Paenibacillus qinlingensis]|uniref:NAD(P)-dependent dehydrogenase (Short-subunit alcohol dehydrogenase family) n=1 Tax=Paenibacillus qinlingensis TaxID=1837343 RepID=A0ABU1NSN2_9BACL|nr:SDR family oxidoreductase [Paenibacillus qinlingensis]MDR6550488.1 NAD(P)-dependent dehydrogenase (short-subunit alcohol dehydrogenase family) [Paenibacillus qinlingensis]